MYTLCSFPCDTYLQSLVLEFKSGMGESINLHACLCMLELDNQYPPKEISLSFFKSDQKEASPEVIGKFVFNINKVYLTFSLQNENGFILLQEGAQFITFYFSDLKYYLLIRAYLMIALSRHISLQIGAELQ